MTITNEKNWNTLYSCLRQNTCICTHMMTRRMDSEPPVVGDDHIPMTATSPLRRALCPCLLRAQQVYTPASDDFCTPAIFSSPVGVTLCLVSSGNSLPPKTQTKHRTAGLLVTIPLLIMRSTKNMYYRCTTNKRSFWSDFGCRVDPRLPVLLSHCKPQLGLNWSQDLQCERGTSSKEYSNCNKNKYNGKKSASLKEVWILHYLLLILKL